jgi:hypothetical protein
VSDVFLAFKELSNGGLFGNESGNEFGFGIQYDNADVNDDGYFNETDTFLLLQHLTGTGTNPLVAANVLPYMMKLVPQDTYNTITKSNWSTFPSYQRAKYPITFNPTSLNTYNVSVTWKGDVNLSHSATPVINVANNSVKSMFRTIASVNEINASIVGENIGGKVVVTISLDPLQQEVVGTQFQLNYDKTVLQFEKVEFKTKGNPLNYGTEKGGYVNIGSLISDGSTSLDKTTEYKITFLPLIGLEGTLGLTSISATDAVNKNGTQLKVKLN